jgi:hypothetical protein
MQSCKSTSSTNGGDFHKMRHERLIDMDQKLSRSFSRDHSGKESLFSMSPGVSTREYSDC